MLMTLCSSGRKATRSGKQQENNCKVMFAGRCGSTTISYNAASGKRTEAFSCHRMNSVINYETYRFQVAGGSEGQSSFTTRTNRTERTVGWTGLDMRTDRSTALLQDFNVQESSKLQFRTCWKQTDSSARQERTCTSHTNLQFLTEERSALVGMERCSTAKPNRMEKAQ